MSHNINIVPDGLIKNKGVCLDKIAQDGISNADAFLKEKHVEGRDILKIEMGKLKSKGIKCELKVQKAKGMRKYAILGFAHGEPFCVFIRWMSEKTKSYGMITTRYRGEDHRDKTPAEVMNV